LRELLGVGKQPAKRRRKRLTVEAEQASVFKIIKAAIGGKDVHTYRDAADATGIDEKTLERAWKLWGPDWVRLFEETTEVQSCLTRLPPT
jgi:hypothetical protein